MDRPRSLLESIRQFGSSPLTQQEINAQDTVVSGRLLWRVALLLAIGVRFDWHCGFEWFRGRYSPFSAVIRASTEDVDLLIRSGAKVNAQGDLGGTPLHNAASRGLLDIANKLIASGASRHLKNEFGQTPADLATLMKHKELAERLRVK